MLAYRLSMSWKMSIIIHLLIPDSKIISTLNLNCVTAPFVIFFKYKYNFKCVSTKCFMYLGQESIFYLDFNFVQYRKLCTVTERLHRMPVINGKAANYRMS